MNDDDGSLSQIIPLVDEIICVGDMNVDLLKPDNVLSKYFQRDGKFITLRDFENFHLNNFLGRFPPQLSRNRFEEISTFSRFDDQSTKPQREEQDKLAAIRDIWEMFVSNCKNSFDEQLVCFWGRCPFRQYIKSNPSRMRIWAAADNKTSYLFNLQVYTGKAPNGAAERKQGLRVVWALADPYHGSWRGITT
ncbi:hypothetical protein JTB14_006348 [Gonioctena quinquepunctata]|nr:hypothetical protein JTB14_006348 [Gonioctena quinquepunctata]